MKKKAGRPKSEIPREKKVTVRLTEAEHLSLEEARARDRKPEKSFTAWVTKKIVQLANKMSGKK